MKRASLIVLAWISPLAIAAQAPIVRATLTPTTDILVGQPVHLVVSVLVPNYFTGTPDFPEFEIDNAIVVLPQDRPQNSSEHLSGITYAAITETYTIYPQQPGEFHLPPAEITIPYASAPPQTTIARLLLPTLVFHADIPTAARDLNYFLPTTLLTIQQKWSSSLKNLRAGDSIIRTITVTATKTQAMLIPPLPIEAPVGLRVYPDEPIVQDQKTDRGEFVLGRRTQSTKYFIQKEGNYTLPSIELKWWNLSTNRLVTATLPAVHFTAVVNPNYIAELPPEPEPTAIAQPKHISPWIKYKLWIRVVAPCFLAFLLLLAISWRFLPPIYRRLQTWRKGQALSEPAYFRSFQHACRHNQAMQSYALFLQWMALAYPERRVDELLTQAADPALSIEFNKLSASLFTRGGKNSRWNGKNLAYLVKKYRSAQNAVTTKHQELLKMNP